MLECTRGWGGVAWGFSSPESTTKLMNAYFRFLAYTDHDSYTSDFLVLLYDCLNFKNKNSQIDPELSDFIYSQLNERMKRRIRLQRGKYVYSQRRKMICCMQENKIVHHLFPHNFHRALKKASLSHLGTIKFPPPSHPPPSTVGGRTSYSKRGD